MTVGRDNRTGPYPSLTARDIRRVHGLRAQSMTGPEIAAAMGISTRTVWRYLAAYLVTTTVGAYPITFIVYPGRRPVLVEGATHR